MNHWRFYGYGTTQYILKQKLNQCQKLLKTLNSIHFSHVLARASRAKAELESLQLARLNGGVVNKDLMSVKESTENILEAEKLFLLQKAKCTYLKNSDLCAKFFHDLIKRNNKQNAIIAMDLEDGSSTMDENIIVTEFVKYYKNLLGASVDRETLNWNWWMDRNMVSADHQKKLIEQITVDEIKMALWDIDNDKVSGPWWIWMFLFQEVLKYR